MPGRIRQDIHWGRIDHLEAEVHQLHRYLGVECVELGDEKRQVAADRAAPLDQVSATATYLNDRRSNLAKGPHRDGR